MVLDLSFGLVKFYWAESLGGLMNWLVISGIAEGALVRLFLWNLLGYKI